MLVQFTISNYGPFGERSTLSLAPVRAYKERQDSLLQTSCPSSPTLLPGVLVYGANASGKSTFFDAAMFMRNEITNSFRRGKGEDIPVKPFLLTREKAESPSGLEMVFIADNGIQYQYGFLATSKRIMGEWLYSGTGRSAKTLFQRVWHEEKGGFSYSPQRMSSTIPGFRTHWLEDVLENRLFLSVAVHKEVAPEKMRLPNDLEILFRYFKKIRGGKSINEISIGPFAELLPTEDGKRWLLEWMNMADLPWNDINIKYTKISDSKEIGALANKGFPLFLSVNKDGPTAMEVYLSARRVDDNVTVPFSFENLSSGTVSWLFLGGAIKNILDGGNIFFVDEIENNLHHHLVRYLWGLFNNAETNPNRAQIIATTHNVGLLLEDDILRRDQVWLADKSRDLSSKLIPLSDYGPRKGENLLKPYLLGRFGGVPRMRNIFPGSPVLGALHEE